MRLTSLQLDDTGLSARGPQGRLQRREDVNHSAQQAERDEPNNSGSDEPQEGDQRTALSELAKSRNDEAQCRGEHVARRAATARRNARRWRLIALRRRFF